MQNDPYAQPQQYPPYNYQQPAAPMPNYPQQQPNPAYAPPMPEQPQQSQPYYHVPPPIPPKQQPRVDPRGLIEKYVAAIEQARRMTTFKFVIIGSIVGLLVAPAIYIFNSTAGIGITAVFLIVLLFILFKVQGHISYLSSTYGLDPRDIKPVL